jgi:hypothetical protein
MRKRLLYLNLIFTLVLAASCEQEVKEDIAAKERIGEVAEKVLVDSTAILGKKYSSLLPTHRLTG